MHREAETVDISIVILTWNSEHYISKCIESIFLDLDGTEYSYEVFIVDNGSQDGTVDLIERMRHERGSSLIPIFLEKNAGTTYSRNLALKRAKGKYICIMDSDVVVGNGTLAGLISVFDNEPSAGLVAPRLFYPDGRWQKSTDDFPTVFTKIRRFLLLKKMEKRESKDITIGNLIPVDYAISALWITKREVLEKVGLLDERIFYAPEDVDYCLRVWLAGYKVIYSTGTHAIHDAQEISRKLHLNRSTIRHIKGLLYYFKKHKYFLSRPRIQKKCN